MNIKTRFVLPPIPDRSHDWMAWDDDNYCPCDDMACGCHESIGNIVGYGPSEREAVEDLYAQIEERRECA